MILKYFCMNRLKYWSSGWIVLSLAKISWPTWQIWDIGIILEQQRLVIGCMEGYLRQPWMNGVNLVPGQEPVFESFISFCGLVFGNMNSLPTPLWFIVLFLFEHLHFGKFERDLGSKDIERNLPSIITHYLQHKNRNPQNLQLRILNSMVCIFQITQMVLVLCTFICWSWLIFTALIGAKRGINKS